MNKEARDKYQKVLVALHCLYLEAPEDVCKDLSTIVIDCIQELEKQLEEANTALQSLAFPHEAVKDIDDFIVEINKIKHFYTFKVT